jgi:pilus assembly protein CpaB
VDRRLVTVLGLSLLFALVVSTIFYQVVAKATSSAGRQKSETKGVVVATRPLPVGVVIGPSDVRAEKAPADQFPKGGFSNVEEVIGRPVISNILVEEPVVEGRLAERGSGLGLAPVIPPGMRGVSVRVNEVVGVAGFVLPGVRVDILVTGSPPERRGPMTTTVLENIQVLSAGQNIQPDARGQPVNVPVVTLLVTPDQAEILTLAGNEGRIQLVLRNSGDQKIERPPGREIGELYGVARSRTRAEATAGPGKAPEPRPQPAPAAEPAHDAAPPAQPPPDEIVVFRGTQKTVEPLGTDKRPNKEGR